MRMVAHARLVDDLDASTECLVPLLEYRGVLCNRDDRISVTDNVQQRDTGLGQR